jgi:hypothetical protein
MNKKTKEFNKCIYQVYIIYFPFNYSNNGKTAHYKGKSTHTKLKNRTQIWESRTQIWESRIQIWESRGHNY